MAWRWLLAGAVIVTVALIFGHAKHDDAVRVPTDGNEVLQQVPSATPGVKELRALEASLREQPDDSSRAAAVAHKSIELARREADPRYWGRAQAALEPWWKTDDAPIEVLLLRATIRQAQHDFDGARLDLQRVVELDPQNAQARLTLAVVQLVTGVYAEATSACTQIQELVPPLVFATCTAQVDSLNGSAAQARETLEHALAQAPRDPQRAWAISVLGEVDIRASDDEAAEKAFREALSLEPEDAYTRAALADLLLEKNRSAEVELLLSARLTDDNAVLRLAIAERARLGKPGPYAQMLEARYQASEARGDTVHLREQARFALEVKDDAARALELATKDFAVQKEPADLRIFMMAALAAKTPQAAKPAADFVLHTGAQEPRLVALAREVRR